MWVSGSALLAALSSPTSSASRKLWTEHAECCVVTTFEGVYCRCVSRRRERSDSSFVLPHFWPWLHCVSKQVRQHACRGIESTACLEGPPCIPAHYNRRGLLPPVTHAHEFACRMNVAITRARRHLVVVGDAGMLLQNEHWKVIIQRASTLPGGNHDAREYQVRSTRGACHVLFAGKTIVTSMQKT